MTLAVVVPCFDEAERLDTSGLAALADVADRVVFVDDGSTDATADRLDRLVADHADRFVVLRLGDNAGKGEAVRRGLREVIADHDVVGYFDADLATPVAELRRLAAVLAGQPDVQAVLASRVALLGHRVERRATRHYLGRVYATAASLVLGIAVYDTQCGAKLFRVGPALTSALDEPFPDRWAFDVELLARLLRPAPGIPRIRPDQLVEVPLHEWRDVGGSKLRPTSAARALVALGGVRLRMRSRAG